MKKSKKFLLVLVFSLLVLLHPCYVCSESVYTITETELKQLEENNQILNIELNKTNLSLQKSEKEKKIIKNVAIASTIFVFVGGFFIGYQIAK